MTRGSIHAVSEASGQGRIVTPSARGCHPRRLRLDDMHAMALPELYCPAGERERALYEGRYGVPADADAIWRDREAEQDERNRTNDV